MPPDLRREFRRRYEAPRVELAAYDARITACPAAFA
jgi:hypothetical protein